MTDAERTAGSERGPDFEPAGRRRSRRTVLATAGLALSTGLAGCLRAPSADGSLAFEHPDAVAVDEPFSMAIEGVPPDATLGIEVEGSGAGRSWSAGTVVGTTEESLDLDTATIVDGNDGENGDDDVPPDLDVPTTLALLQFADLPFHRFDLHGEETLTYRVFDGDVELGATSLHRRHPDPREFEDPDDDGLVGRFYEPPDGGPAPGVVVLHGSEGELGFVADVAATLARNGFATLALQYFGAPGLPDALAEIPLEYVERAVEWVLEQPVVTGERVGAMGYSRGGELALLVGSESDRVGPVVSIVGSGLVWQGVTATGEVVAPWTVDGEPVAYVPPVPGDWDDRALVDVFRESLEAASSDEREAATIPVERIDGRVLMVSGAADDLWDATWFQDVSLERLTEVGHDDHDHLVYEEAGHGIAPPYRPVSGSTYSPLYDLGGTEAGNAEAAHDHWPAVLETLSTLE